MSRIRPVLLGGLVGLGIALAWGLVVAALTDVPELTAADSVGSDKARRLAIRISEGLNGAAFAGLVLIPVCAVVAYRRRKR